MLDVKNNETGTKLDNTFKMAASRSKLYICRLTRNIPITIRLKHSKCSSTISASMASSIVELSNDKKYCGGRVLSSFCLVSLCTGTSTSKSSTNRNGLLRTAYKFHLFNDSQISSSKCITTSALHLNGKEAISTGKRKLKEKIEKVKELRESILTIPNMLSAFRIVAAPFLSYFIISEEFTIAAVLFGVAGITDMLDGYIARNFKNQKSVFGTLLDPVADKILMSVLTISLTAAELLPIPLTVLILSRDVLLIVAAFYFRYKSLPSPKTISRYFDVSLATVELRPNVLGKVNTALQLGLVGSTLFAPILGYIDHPYLQSIWLIVGTSTVLSSFSYLFSINTSVRYLK